MGQQTQQRLYSMEGAGGTKKQNHDDAALQNVMREHENMIYPGGEEDTCFVL